MRTEQILASLLVVKLTAMSMKAKNPLLTYLVVASNIPRF